MYKIRVFITLKEGILDPAGIATENTLHKLDFADVRDVRIGKLVEFTVEQAEDLEARVKQMCEKLLVNTVMETYRYEIEEIAS